MTLPRGVQRQVSRLNALTGGPGAIRLPSNVSRLELRFNRFVGEQNVGAKRFWRSELPPIQFYNPQVPISVKRFEPPTERKSELIVEFMDGSLKSVPADNKQQAEILQGLIDATGAKSVDASEQVRL